MLPIERALSIPYNALITSENRKAAKKANKKRKFSYDFSTPTVFIKQYASDHLKIQLAACVDFCISLKRNNVRLHLRDQGLILFFTWNLKFNRGPHTLFSGTDTDSLNYSSLLLSGSPKSIAVHNENVSKIQCRTVNAFMLSNKYISKFITIGKRVLVAPAEKTEESCLAQTLNLLATETDTCTFTENQNVIGSEMYIQDFVGTLSDPFKVTHIQAIKPNVNPETGSTYIDIPALLPVLTDSTESEVPFVSLITPTFCNENLFFLTVMSFLAQTYPADRLEWLIIDDTPEAYGKSVKDILPREDDRIHHFQINTPKRIPLGKKLNIGIGKAKGDYIVHFFDSVYYPPESVMYRMATILDQIKQETNKFVVGSTSVGCYNILRKDSFTYSEYDLHKVHNVFQEASLAYPKNLWMYKHFSELIVEDNTKNVLSITWLKDLHHFMLDLPFTPVCVKLLTDLDASGASMAKFGKTVSGTGNNGTNGSTGSTCLYDSFPSQIKESILLIYQGLMRKTG